MRTWLYFILPLLPIKKCSSLETLDLMGPNNAVNRRRTDFGINSSTRILSKTTKDTQRRHEEHSRKTIRVFSTDNVVSFIQPCDVVVGSSSLDDPCFRIYNECIVVDAEPYERLSVTQLDECKQRCMQSQNGPHRCHSFVYYAVKKICDFFAHQGDQTPAKLLKYYNHLYLEPTFDDQCLLEYMRKSKKGTVDAAAKEDTKGGTCGTDEVAKYLQTQGFMLDSANRIELRAYNLGACIDACTNNIVRSFQFQDDDKEHTFDCRSFDYNQKGCSLFAETAIPRGTRQLKQNPYVNYYEKICVKNVSKSRRCEIVNRLPQIILVGFAEVVVTTQSFVGCFENCLKSQQLFAMNCTSGMYFYEELEQNCILNTENGQTQKNLLVDENTDIVDYFEVSCPQRELK